MKLCKCGCDEETVNGKFKPGHDQKMRSKDKLQRKRISPQLKCNGIKRKTALIAQKQKDKSNCN